MNRRGFLSCALCATVGLAADAVDANAQMTGGVTRTILQKTEYPGDKFASLLVSAEVLPNAVVLRHTHPGVEAGYVASGGGTLSVNDQPDLVLKTGDSYRIAPETPHSFRNVGEKTLIVGMLVVEKDKPMASPAPE